MKFSNPKLPLAVTLIGVCVSLIFSFLIFPRIQDPLNLNLDPDRNGELGANLYLGNGFVYNGSLTPAVDRGPIYPFILAGIFFLTGGVHAAAVQVFQAFCLGFTSFLAFLIGRKLINEKVGMAAALLCAFHPMLVWYTARIWIETVHTLLVALVCLAIILCYERPTMLRAFWAGIAFGIAILTKSILILFPVVFAILLALKYKKESIRSVVLMLAVILVVVSPWTVRNYGVSKAFVPVHVSLGLNLMQGDAVGEYWARMPFSTIELWFKGRDKTDSTLAGTQFTPTDPRGDRLLAVASFRQGLSHPLFFMKRSLINFLTLWYLSESKLKSLFLMILEFPLLIYTVIASVRLWKESGLARPMILLVIYYVVIHSLIIGWARYSVPIVPLCLILTASLLEARRAGHQPGATAKRGTPLARQSL